MYMDLESHSDDKDKYVPQNFSLYNFFIKYFDQINHVNHLFNRLVDKALISLLFFLPFT